MELLAQALRDRVPHGELDLEPEEVLPERQRPQRRARRPVLDLGRGDALPGLRLHARARARADMPSGGGPPAAALATSGVSSLVSSVPVGIVSSMVSAPWGAGSLRIASIAGPQARVVSLVSGWTGTLQDVKSRT